MKENLDLGLKDKVAIVAGGGSNGDGIGNGRAASILLAEAGAKVLVIGTWLYVFCFFQRG